MKGNVDKHSDALGRDSVWEKVSRINRLPRILCVQFLRFFWKATPDSADHAGVKCKMLRVIFILILFLFSVNPNYLTSQFHSR